MRIIGYLEHPALKITVFKMDTRLSVKFESDLFELTYKFRMKDGLESLEDIKRLVDQDFTNAVLQQLSEMRKTADGALGRHHSQADDEDFDVII